MKKLNRLLLPLFLLGFIGINAQSVLDGIVFNEVMPDPNSSTNNFDTDGDGSFETADEFIELYNTTAAAVDMSGWEFWDGNTVFTVPATTIVPANGFLVLVSGYAPGTPPSNYLVTGGSLSNGGDDVFLYNPTSDSYIGLIYGSGVASPTGLTTAHPTATSNGVDDFGSDTDGLSIQAVPDGSASYAIGTPTPGASNSIVVTTSVDFAFPTTNVAENAGTANICLSITNPDAANATDVVIDLNASSVGILNTDYSLTQTGAVATPPLTLTFPAGSSADTCIVITSIDDTMIEGDETVIFDIISVTGGTSAAVGSVGSTTITLVDDDFPTATCANPGDLVITEFMQNPSAVGDNNGEWFEVFNPTANDIDMVGYEISDAGSDNFTVNTNVIVPAGGYAVFAEEGDMTINGGVTADYDYGGMSLANGDDEIIISCNGVVIDSVYYDGGPNYPDPTGASTSLNPGGDASTNDTGSNWCEATSTYGGGDFGTPGAANDACGSTCPPDYDAGNALTGTETGTGGVNSDGDYETDGIISSNQMITSGMVDYDSAVEINLTADFEVVLGAVFCAFIDGCNGMGGVVNPIIDNDNTNSLQIENEETTEQKTEK